MLKSALGKALNKPTRVRLGLLILAGLLMIGLAYFLVSRQIPTADVPTDDHIPSLAGFKAVPVCLGQSSEVMPTLCDGELAIAIAGSSPISIEQSDLPIDIALHYTPTEPDDFDHPEYNPQWNHLTTIESGDQELDDQGELVAWRSSTGFLFFLRGLKPDGPGPHTYEFEARVHDWLSDRKSLPAKAVIRIPPQDQQVNP